MENSCFESEMSKKKTGEMVEAIVNQVPVLGGLGAINFS